MIDPVGNLIVELRDSAGITAIVGSRVWGAELPANAGADPRPYILVKRQGTSRLPRHPLSTVRIVVECVEKSPRLAAALYGAVSEVLHDKGPRVSSSGIAVYRSQEEVGGQPDIDPVTGWPLERAIYDVLVAAQAVA